MLKHTSVAFRNLKQIAKILSRSNQTACSKFYIKTEKNSSFSAKNCGRHQNISHYDPIFEKISPDF